MMSTDKSEGVIENGFFASVVKSYNFAGTKLRRCFIEDVEFRNCIFDEATIFKDCSVAGSLAFTSCTRDNAVQIDGGQLSMGAEYTFSKLKGSKLPEGTALELAREVVERALRRFRGPFGFHSISASTRGRGLPRSNPLRSAVWDALLKHKVIQKDPESPTPGGALMIVDDPLVKKEIQGLFDNANLGRRLEQLVRELAREA